VGGNDLSQSKINKAVAEEESKILLCIQSLLNSSIERVSIDDRYTLFVLRESLDRMSAMRLKALGFSIHDSKASFDGRLCKVVEMTWSRSFDHVSVLIIKLRFMDSK
jgi:hypothetical protein